MARGRATGYKVLKYNLGPRREVKVTFNPSVMKRASEDMFYVTSSDLQEYSHLIYGDNVTVEYFVSDTLFFRFPQQDSRRVPVSLVHSLSFRPQYMGDGEITCTPDSITIYGEKFKIDKINQVFTSPVKHSDLYEDIQGLVDIEKIRGVRFSVPEVRYSLDVTRYVEISRTLQVRTVNVPAGKRLLVYPSSVEALFRCKYPMNVDAVQGIVMQVDYNDFVNSLSGKCSVRPSGLNERIITCDIDPVAVDCVLEDR